MNTELNNTKSGFLTQIKSYPRTFWVANTMEIFERLSWYGWFTVMALYVTAPVTTGGLGFTTEVRGNLMGIVPFFLYLMPVLTGALADRFGFKRMFIIGFCIMIVSYYSLGQFTSLPTFFMAFMFVALGAAIFKPVVVGTVARVTSESNSALGFGIFYMMVNIGGFLGPIFAGIVRGWSWDYVFLICSGWAVVNLLIVLFIYKEPPTPKVAEDKPKRSVMENAIEVLGNARFFLTVGIILVALMLAGLGGWAAWFTWKICGIFCILWLILNGLYDRILIPGSGRVNSDGPKTSWFKQRMHCSNWRFAVFLLIMSGFWTSFNQIFITMPEYIRDFSDTRPLTSAFESVFGKSDQNDPSKGIASKIATISKDERKTIEKTLQTLVDAQNASNLSEQIIKKSAHSLLQSKVRIQPGKLHELIKKSGKNIKDLTEDIISKVANLKVDGEKSVEMTLQTLVSAQKTGNLTDDVVIKGVQDLFQSNVQIKPAKLKEMIIKSVTNIKVLTDKIIVKGRQFNPEFIININAGAIVIFQILVSLLMARFHRFTTMIVGMIVAGVGIGLSMFAGGEGMLGAGGSIWIVCLGLFIFSFGEMMASPTSQEYVGRIAPEDKKALYMGYYFVAIALGNLFGGILSGQFYGWLARDLQRPDLLWAFFGILMFITAIIFVLYNKFALPKSAAGTLTNEG